MKGGIPNVGFVASMAGLILFIAGTGSCTDSHDSESASQSSDVSVSAPAKSGNPRHPRRDEFIESAANSPNPSTGCDQSISTPGTYYQSLISGGWERDYVLTVPDSSVPTDTAYPLLIVMHGFGGNSFNMRNMLGRGNIFEVKYVVVYPDGAGATNSSRGWNSGHPQCCGTALRDNVDDVAFIRALVDEVSVEICIELNQVYATGFSNGGDMAQRLACDASDIFAAISSVAGRFDYHVGHCPGDRPVPSILYRGELDRIVPIASWDANNYAIPTIPALHGFEQIALNHHCANTPSTSRPADNTVCLEMTNCDVGFELSLCRTESIGHCWPGLNDCSPIVRAPNSGFSVNRHMIEFFSRHRMTR